MQIVNVALGGTLRSVPRSDIDHDIQGKRNLYTHRAHLIKNSLLQGIYEGSNTIDLNGGHAQTISHISPLLCATAIADDGTIEAVEAPDYPFLLGVRSHPELSPNRYAARNFFKLFINYADKRPAR